MRIFGLQIQIQKGPLTKHEARCWWRSWLRHCATSRKVAGSIPDCVIENFHWHNTSGRTMALELTQDLTEMSTRNISWGKDGRLPRANNLTTFMCRLSWNLGASNSWNPQGLPRPVMGLLYRLPPTMQATYDNESINTISILIIEARIVSVCLDTGGMERMHIYQSQPAVLCSAEW